MSQLLSINRLAFARAKSFNARDVIAGTSDDGDELLQKPTTQKHNKDFCMIDELDDYVSKGESIALLSVDVLSGGRLLAQKLYDSQSQNISAAHQENILNTNSMLLYDEGIERKSPSLSLRLNIREIVYGTRQPKRIRISDSLVCVVVIYGDGFCKEYTRFSFSYQDVWVTQQEKIDFSFVRLLAGEKPFKMERLNYYSAAYSVYEPVGGALIDASERSKKLDKLKRVIDVKRITSLRYYLTKEMSGEAL